MRAGLWGGGVEGVCGGREHVAIEGLAIDLFIARRLSLIYRR